jgi:hypothetical protein
MSQLLSESDYISRLLWDRLCLDRHYVRDDHLRDLIILVDWQCWVPRAGCDVRVGALGHF